MINVPDVKTDERWQNYNKKSDEIVVNYHCELSTDQLKSFIAIPLILNKNSNKLKQEIIGVIRMVSREVGFFTKEKEDFLIKLSNIISEKINNAVSFSELISRGSTLSLEDLCDKVVEDLNHHDQGLLLAPVHENGYALLFTDI